MHILRTSVSILIIIALTCCQLSCDSFLQRSVLYRILRKLKFRVVGITAEFPSKLSRYDALFLQDLKHPPKETDIQHIRDFVRAGGTLIVSGGNVQVVNRFVSEHGITVKRLPKRSEYAQRNSEEPFFRLHPVNEIYVRTYYTLEIVQNTAAVLYGTRYSAAILTLRVGKGRIFITTSAFLFKDNGLKHGSNATLLYNLMSTLPPNARIGLAQGKYIPQAAKPTDSFPSFVFKTPIGLAAVYICLIIFIYLILRGRRFGKPLDIQENNRRLSSEYVHAMTALYQKGNTRMDILKHIRDKFRADLGLRWRVNPNLDTTTFLEELTQHGADDEDDKLTNLLKDLDVSRNISESQLLGIAKRVEVYHATSNIRK